MSFSESVKVGRWVSVNPFFKKGKFVPNLFYNNVEWRNSLEWRKIISAIDVKTNIKQL